MRISDWSSDVCSSDLENLVFPSRLPLHENADVIGEWSLALVKFHMSLHAEGTVLIIDESDTAQPAVVPAFFDANFDFGLSGYVHPDDTVRLVPVRSDERRDGKECVCPCRSRWS